MMIRYLFRNKLLIPPIFKICKATIMIIHLLRKAIRTLLLKPKEEKVLTSRIATAL